MIALASAISAGKEWAGRAVTKGSTVLVHFEGDQMGKRLAAMKQEGGDISNIYLLRAKGSLSPAIERASNLEHPSELEKQVQRELIVLGERLKQEGRPPIVLVVFDTLRASMSGSEDSSENTSAYIRAVGRIAVAAHPDAAIAVVHHAGWAQEGKVVRERGSSAIRGNVDATIILEAGAPDPALASLGHAIIHLRTSKLRDEGKPEILSLIRRKVYLPMENTHGKPVTSCVVEEAEPAVVRNMKRLLEAIAEHPAISSKDELAKLLSTSKTKVVEVFDQALAEGLLFPTKKQEPYKLTPKGLLLLDIPVTI
jgi:hypothetical protein